MGFWSFCSLVNAVFRFVVCPGLGKQGPIAEKEDLAGNWVPLAGRRKVFLV